MRDTMATIGMRPLIVISLNLQEQSTENVLNKDSTNQKILFKRIVSALSVRISVATDIGSYFLMGC